MRRQMLILGALIFLFFSPIFWNGFCGDDQALFLDNTFYKHSANLIRVFTPGYNVAGEFLAYSGSDDLGSGSVAYRPVTTLTFFLDAGLWKENPFGYHLTSLLLHVLNTLLLYRIALVFFPARMAFLGVLLFAIHPVNTEAVAAIAYRSDLLAAFFVLVSFMAWIYFRRTRAVWMLALCAGGYFLALFSKETALFLPLVFLVADVPGCADRSSRLGWRYYVPFPFIACFYMYVYFFVFPNTVLSAPAHVAHGIGEHVSVLIQILAIYIRQIFLPFSAGVIPALFSPQPVPFFSPGFIMEAAVVGIFLCFFAVACSRPKYVWPSLWAMIFLLPALIPDVNPNPVALRYLYLPSAGGMILLAAGILRAWDIYKDKMSSMIRVFLCVTGVLLLGTPSFVSNLMWKNNFYIADAWVKYYPDHYMGYGIRGIEFFRGGMYEFAARDLAVAVHDPRCTNLNYDYYLGGAYLLEKKEEQAKIIFEGLIHKAPFFDKGYLGVGYYYLNKKQYPLAVLYLKRAFALYPDDNNAVSFLTGLNRAQGAVGLEKGLALIEKVWGRGSRLEKIRESAKNLSSKEIDVLLAPVNAR